MTKPYQSNSLIDRAYYNKACCRTYKRYYDNMDEEKKEKKITNSLIVYINKLDETKRANYWKKLEQKCDEKYHRILEAYNQKFR